MDVGTELPKHADCGIGDGQRECDGRETELYDDSSARQNTESQIPPKWQSVAIEIQTNLVPTLEVEWAVSTLIVQRRQGG